MCPWKYPAMMIDIPKRKHATRLRTNGTVGLATCVLVTFVLWFVSVDVFLGVFDTGEPTSFSFCSVIKENGESWMVGEQLALS